jgi:hypothetical protein
VSYGPEEHPSQPLKDREVRTNAYECECGMAFTQSDGRKSK